MSLTVKVEGLRELDKALGELPKASGKAVLRRVGKMALEPMAKMAAARAPDDPLTGAPDLHRSIIVSTRSSAGKRSKRKKASVEMYMGPHTKGGYPQAIVQEFGTINHPAHPYMTPAWEGEKRHALEIIKDKLGDEIRKTAARVAKRAAVKKVRA